MQKDGVAAASRPTRPIMIAGQRRRASAVERALSQLDVAIERRAELDPSTRLPSVLAIVLVSPHGRETLASIIRRVRSMPEGGERMPLFAVVDESPPDRQIRRLYREGATAVIEWPREGLILPRLLAEILAIDLVRGKNRTPDVALARALRARLRLLPWDASGVELEAVDGTVHVSGKVPSLWHKTDLEQFIAEAPGVQNVGTDDLWVAPSGLSDHHIAGAVRAVLRSTSSIDESTLSLVVRSGHVILAGTVADRRELDRIIGLLTHVSGVREIENATVVSPEQKMNDRTTFRRLSARLAATQPDLAISVAVFGSTVVLSGRVPRLSISRDIERLVRQDEAVSRIINKLQIRS